MVSRRCPLAVADDLFEPENVGYRTMRTAKGGNSEGENTPATIKTQKNSSENLAIWPFCHCESLQFYNFVLDFLNARNTLSFNVH